VDAFIHDASQWVVREALFFADNGEVVLHPSMHSVTRIWRSDRPMEERFPLRSPEKHPTYLTSPVKRVCMAAKSSSSSAMPS
jgi:hypothetical protein